MEEMNEKGKVIHIFEHKKMSQNRKILRYRSCLAQLAIVCVNLKSLNGEILSYQFCQFFKKSVETLNAIRASIQLEIQKQSKAGWIQKENRRGKASIAVAHALTNQRNVTLRSRILVILHSFCEVLLSELHTLNYEHISDKTYEMLGELSDLYTRFHREIIKERDMQSQCKTERLFQKAS